MAGDELLMINGQSLVGLSHQDAVALLRSAAGLVQLVVASKVWSSPWWSPQEFVQVLRGKGMFFIENHMHTFAPLNLTHSYGKYISSCHKSVANPQGIDQLNYLFVLPLSFSVQMSLYLFTQMLLKFWPKPFS